PDPAFAELPAPLPPVHPAVSGVPVDKRAEEPRGGCRPAGRQSAAAGCAAGQPALMSVGRRGRPRSVSGNGQPDLIRRPQRAKSPFFACNSPLAGLQTSQVYSRPVVEDPSPDSPPVKGAPTTDKEILGKGNSFRNRCVSAPMKPKGVGNAPGQ